jgi:hypothetical protein
MNVWLEVEKSVFAAFGVMVFCGALTLAGWCVWQAGEQRGEIRENEHGREYYHKKREGARNDA